jgi:hypothetical protein
MDEAVKENGEEDVRSMCGGDCDSGPAYRLEDHHWKHNHEAEPVV